MTRMVSPRRPLVIGAASVLIVLMLASILLVLPCSDCPPAIGPTLTTTAPADEPSAPGSSQADKGSEKEVADAGLEVGVADLSSIREGDSISISIPEESRSLQGKVLTIERSKAGNRIIKGRLEDPLRPETTYPFVFTVGQTFTFGTIHTSLNRYQMQVQDGVGRMIAATSLLKEIDYSQPDYVLPQPQREELRETQE